MTDDRQDIPATQRAEVDKKDAQSPRGGIFGPIWELFDQARDVHPFVKFVLPALLLVVVAVVMIKYVAPYAGDIGPIRTVLYLFFLVFFLMAFFATFADFFVDTTNAPVAQRLMRIALVVAMAAIGIFCTLLVADAKPAHCKWVALLAGQKAAEQCRVEKVVPPPVLSGIVKVKDDPFVVIKDASVDVLIKGSTDGRSERPKVLPTGDFSQTLAATDIGKTATVSVGVPSFGVLQRKNVTIGRDGALAEFEIDRGGPGTRIAVKQTTDAADLAPVQQGTAVAVASTRVDWFDGAGLRYDIFYCQAPDGDAVRSKILATQLQAVLMEQANIGGANVRAWPMSSTPGYGNIRIPGVAINQPVNGQKDAQVTSLRRLWSPYLADGVAVAPRFVSSNFPKMTAVVCI